MTKYKEQLRLVLHQTLELQNRDGAAYDAWRRGPRDTPIPPGIPAEGGGFYPTTATALDALVGIVDSLLRNDAALARAISRDTAYQGARSVLGQLLDELTQLDEAEAWKRYKTALLKRFDEVKRDYLHYVPVWLFVRQEFGSFEVGPVAFIDADSWLDLVERTKGTRPGWRGEVEQIWRNEITLGAVENAKTAHDLDVRAIARFVRSEQRVAAVLVKGFDQIESGKRGLLAVRVALDALRVLIPGPNNARLATAADHGPPSMVDRMNQRQGTDLFMGSSHNRPGVGGAPGLAQELIDSSQEYLTAAGDCIEVLVEAAAPQLASGCPHLSEKWVNSVHWFGRACVSDVDFAALTMVAISMDVLSGGREEQGILALGCSLLQMQPEDVATSDGKTLKSLVASIYKWRSEIAHGSKLAVDLDLSRERALAQSYASELLYRYPLELRSYGALGKPDDRDSFARWLASKAMQP